MSDKEHPWLVSDDNVWEWGTVCEDYSNNGDVHAASTLLAAQVGARHLAPGMPQGQAATR